MVTKKPKFLLYCTIVLVLVNLYEFYLLHKFPILPSVRNLILLNYPYEKFLTVVILLTPLLLFLLWLLSYNRAKYTYFPVKPRKVTHFIAGRFKWEVRIYNNEEFYVDKIPFCAKHNLRMISNGTLYSCPKKIKDHHCPSRFLLRDYEDIYKKAYSYIENQIKFH